MPTTDTTDIRQWTLAAHTEPNVRIGVVLEEDGQKTIELSLPTGGFNISHDGASLGGLTGPCKAKIVQDADGVTLESNGQTYGPTKRLRVEPGGAVPLEAGSGIKVHNVVAGRGFHWQKYVDQTLAGALEFVPKSNGTVMVNELPLEHYLAGVITAEMSGGCPVEFLKAQCIVARSWLLAMTEAKHSDDPFDRCNDDCCQRYQGTDDMSPAAIEAAQGSRGLVLLDPKGKVLDANYAKSCGGVSELAEHVWGEPKPGISAVVDAPQDDPVQQFYPVTENNLDEFLDGDWLKQTRAYCSTHAVPVASIRKYLGRVDEVDDYFRWTVSYTRAELEAVLRDKLPLAAGLEKLTEIKVLARGVSGRVSRLSLRWLDGQGQEKTCELDSEYRIREALHRGFLYSSAFALRVEQSDAGDIDRVTLRGAGWGHGAGLCQIGALGMGLAGHDAKTICLHYYPDATLEQAYD